MLVEESIANLQHAFVVQKYLDDKAPRFNLNEETTNSLEEQYTALLIQDVGLRVDFRKKASEHLIVQTPTSHYLVEAYHPEEDLLDARIIEGSELEAVLNDENIPIIKLSNISRHLQERDVLELGANSYHQLCALKEQGIIGPNSE